VNIADLRSSWKTVLLVTTVAWASSAASVETFEFRFWPAPSAKKDPRFLEMHEGPCGEVATARVRTMPKYSHLEPFAPERVFELDSVGKVLRSWNIPVDSEPLALDGNDLLFSFNATSYRVTTQGTVQRAPNEIKTTKAEPAQCTVPKAFQGSGYAGCWRHSDLRTKQLRLLVYQGVCT
jgi:hypothetical protein